MTQLELEVTRATVSVRPQHHLDRDLLGQELRD